jgi:hypothetical protein
MLPKDEFPWGVCQYSASMFYHLTFSQAVSMLSNASRIDDDIAIYGSKLDYDMMIVLVNPLQPVARVFVILIRSKGCAFLRDYPLVPSNLQCFVLRFKRLHCSLLSHGSCAQYRMHRVYDTMSTAVTLFTQTPLAISKRGCGSTNSFVFEPWHQGVLIAPRSCDRCNTPLPL